MSDDAPISLTDDQLLAVITCAEVIPLEDRSRFLHARSPTASTRLSVTAR